MSWVPTEVGAGCGASGPSGIAADSSPAVRLESAGESRQRVKAEQLQIRARRSGSDLRLIPNRAPELQTAPRATATERPKGVDAPSPFGMHCLSRPSGTNSAYRRSNQPGRRPRPTVRPACEDFRPQGRRPNGPPPSVRGCLWTPPPAHRYAGRRRSADRTTVVAPADAAAPFEPATLSPVDAAAPLAPPTVRRPRPSHRHAVRRPPPAARRPRPRRPASRRPKLAANRGSTPRSPRRADARRVHQDAHPREVA